MKDLKHQIKIKQKMNYKKSESNPFGDAARSKLRLTYTLKEMCKKCEETFLFNCFYT